MNGGKTRCALVVPPPLRITAFASLASPAGHFASQEERALPRSLSPARCAQPGLRCWSDGFCSFGGCRSHGRGDALRLYSGRAPLRGSFPSRLRYRSVLRTRPLRDRPTSRLRERFQATHASVSLREKGSAARFKNANASMCKRRHAGSCVRRATELAASGQALPRRLLPPHPRKKPRGQALHDPKHGNQVRDLTGVLQEGGLQEPCQRMGAVGARQSANFLLHKCYTCAIILLW
jgi:hypothetical protein